MNRNTHKANNLIPLIIYLCLSSQVDAQESGRYTKSGDKIVYPQKTAMLTSEGLIKIATGGVVGLAVLPCIGVAAAALVPASMATFGTVVAGVGTIHAPLSALGVSAILQASAVGLVTPAAALVGGAVGALQSLFL
jgi:hypothetical protein